MRLISFEEADPLLEWSQIADAMHQGHSLPKAEIGDLLLQSAPNALLTRGAWIDGLGMAIKSMSVFPENTERDPAIPSIQGGVLLFEGKTGGLKAVIDGILITKWKTAGDSILGARLLAKPEPKTHVMVGAGTVAASIIEAYHAEFPSIERFVIYNRTEERAKALAETLSKKIPGIETTRNLADACKRADILTSATMTTEPILSGEWFKPGTHVDLIGAYKPNMREAKDDLLLKSSIFVDSRDTTFGHIGEIEIPLKAGTICREDVLGDLYDLCAKSVGRTSENEITLFKNGGGAHLDLMTGIHVFDKCDKSV